MAMAWRPLRAAPDDCAAPAPRSGHATALLEPSASVLLFGGSNGDVFLDDLHVLEPKSYAAPSSSAADGSHSQQALELSGTVGDLAGFSQSSSVGSQNSGADGDDDEPPELVWKRLVTTYAPAHPVAGENDTLPNVGGGRDNHSMHYVPAPRDEEQRDGMRVLVVGNVIVASESGAMRFEMDELRVEELRVRQPQLEAQWQPRRIASAWAPRARQAHCSVLVGDRLFCFGGKNAATTAFYNDMFYLDVVRNEWVNPPLTGSFPAPRAFASMAAVRDRIFLHGGYDGRQQFGGLYVYSVPLSRWDKVAIAGEKPSARMNHSMTFVAPNHLVVFGGRELSRRLNDVSLFDVTTESWTQLSADSDAQSRVVARRGSSSRSRRSPPIASNGPVASNAPMGRTAHAAIHYDTRANASERLLVFGGYGGSHKWLSDLQLLTIPARAFQTSATPEEADTDETATALDDYPPSQRGLALTRVKDEKARSQSAPAVLSQPHPRPPSRTENPSVLSDITNLAAQPAATPAATAAAASTNRPLKAAIGKRRLAAHMLLQSAARELKKRKRQDDSQDTLSSGGETQSSQVGTQTTLLQLMQFNERHEMSIARILALLTHEEQAPTRPEDFGRTLLQRHAAQLENQLSAADLKIAALERKLELCEKEKFEAKEQLAAADTELFVVRKSQQAVSAHTAEILAAIKQSDQYHFAASNLLEDRLSRIHNALDEMRHSSGERTETDDSPQKKDSMFPDDSRSDASQPHLYPERVVINLEERLRSALASNVDMADKMKEMELRLKRAEATSEQIRQLSLAWMHESS